MKSDTSNISVLTVCIEGLFLKDSQKKDISTFFYTFRLYKITIERYKLAFTRRKVQVCIR